MFDILRWLLSGPNDAGRTINVWTNDDISPEAMAVDDLSLGATIAGTPIPQAAPRPMWQQAQDQVAALEKIDPDFSDVGFLEQATKTYAAALAAEGAMTDDLADAATAHFHDSLAQKISQWQSAGTTRHISDVKIDPPTLFKVSVDGLAQLITVRFTGSSVRYTGQPVGGTIVDGSTQPAYFTEFGVFSRPAGTTSPKSTAAGAPSHCPGCGAPVEPGIAVCPYCRTPLTGTGASWQIDKISASPYT